MTVTGCRAAGWLLLLGLTGFLGSAPLEAAGTDFYTVPPCRLFDTRGVAGPFGGPNLAAQESRGFGAAGRCGVSSSAEAVAVNVTVVPQGTGYVSLLPAGSSSPPATATITFLAGKVRSNNAIVPLGSGGGLRVVAFSSAEVAVIVDVTGYFVDGALEATTAAKPAFHPPPGTYNGERTVDIVTSTPGAQIRYTTDGSAPSPTLGTLYAGPVTLTSDTNLRAIAYKAGLSNSPVTQGTYDLFQQPVLFLATLTPQSGAVSLGSGMATLLLAGDEQTAILRSTHSNLSGGLTAHHIHAPDGQIIFDLDTTPPAADGSRVWNIVQTGSWTRQQILDALHAGQCYLNLHTPNYLNGEIKGFLRVAAGSITFTPPPPPPPLPPGAPSPYAASRFLTQATFGPTPEAIVTVQSQGYAAWINAQFAQPVVSHVAYLDALPDGGEQPNWIARESFWKQAIQGPDQLRQRVAFALSEIFVVSSEDSDLFESEPVAVYMDLLNQGAFGNFRQLLESVTLSPSMGVYLDMLSNDKEDPETGQNPNENYAREILQLFSIGLYKLHPDGTLQLDEWGLPIDTYDQEVIKGFAQVFTGWTHANQDRSEEWRFYWPEHDWRHPMEVWTEHHSTGAKLLLNGVTLPAGQAPQTDLAAAMDNIFLHPNTGPFLCKQLIQRLVTSNPSPAYVYRCGQAFANSAQGGQGGQGVRGDLKAVVRSILLDWEARSPDVLGQPGYGKVREPILRFVAMLRALRAQPPADGRFRYYWQSSAEWGLNQSPYQAPTVFNFFDPAYAQPGPIAGAGLVSPELQIINETSVFGSSNFLHPVVFDGYTDDGSLTLDYSYFTGAGSDSGLLDRVNLVFYAGQLSAETRAIFAEALADSDFPDDPQERVSTLLWMVSLSPEFMGQR